jgi:hypothetical protein
MEIHMPELTDLILEKRGHFWWHGEKTPRGRFALPFGVPGILTVRVDGRVRLTVTDSLVRSKFLAITSPNAALLEDNPGAFKGLSIAGKIDGESRCVYLRNIVYRALGRTVEGKPSEQFDSDFCLVGDKAITRSAKSLRFSKLSIALTGLEQWIWNDALMVSKENVNGKKRWRDVSYTNAPIDYTLEDGKISLRTDVHCTAFEESPYREISLRQNEWLEYSRTRATTAEALRQEFGHIEEFFAILTGTYYSLNWPVISRTKGDNVETYTLYFWRNMEKSQPPEMTNLWTTFPQVQDKFGTLYSNWRKKRRQYGPGFYLYLGALRNIPMYIEHRFVNLIWGIESLHRGMNPKPAESKSLKRKIQGILRKAAHLLNSDERSWLKGQLRNRTEPPLEHRITSTFAGLPWKITKTSLDAFAVRCRIRRNNISHYGGSEDKNEDRGAFLREIMELTEGLTPLYHGALLQEIGLDEKTLVDCTRRPIGSRIRRGLELAKLKANGIKPPEPVDFGPLLKEQRKYVNKWRRRQVSKS